MNTRNIISGILICISAIVIGWQATEINNKKRELEIWKQSHEVIKYQRDCLNDSIEHQRLINLAMNLNNNDTAVFE